MQRGLLHRTAAVQGAGEGADGARDDQELVYLAVGQTVLRRPHQRFEFLQLAVVGGGVLELGGYITLVATADPNLALVGEQRLLIWIEHQTVEECVLWMVL